MFKKIKHYSLPLSPRCQQEWMEFEEHSARVRGGQVEVETEGQEEDYV